MKLWHLGHLVNRPTVNCCQWSLQPVCQPMQQSGRISSSCHAVSAATLAMSNLQTPHLVTDGCITKHLSLVNAPAQHNFKTW